jgi:hypothetical protein
VPNQVALETIVVAAEEQVSTPMSGETVVLQMKSGKYFSLNRVGGFVWSQIQTATPVSSVVDAVAAKFDVERGRCEADVLRLINRLVDAGLVQAR